jgi:hypothetical protein
MRTGFAHPGHCPKWCAAPAAAQGISASGLPGHRRVLGAGRYQQAGGQATSQVLSSACPGGVTGSMKCHISARRPSRVVRYCFGQRRVGGGRPGDSFPAPGRRPNFLAASLGKPGVRAAGALGAGGGAEVGDLGGPLAGAGEGVDALAEQRARTPTGSSLAPPASRSFTRAWVCRSSTSQEKRSAPQCARSPKP